MPILSKSEKQGLWLLVPKASDEEKCIDVFALHGLGGDKYQTWTENGKLWLRDLLPEQLPEARIFTYGYDSTVAFSKSAADVDDFARDFLHRVDSVRKSSVEQTRRMVFICHSLGGILFKQALVTCHNNKHYGHLLDKFHGVVFMGTPHGGSDIAFWASYAANITNTFSLGTRTHKDLVKILKKDSDFLGSLSQKFIHQSQFMHILSFYETEKFPMMSCRIVEKESTHLDVSNEVFLPIKANHRTMCHFSDFSSQKYIAASSAIVNLVRTNADVAASLEFPLLRYRKELNKWLDPLPMVDDYLRKRFLRLEDTCSWINQQQKFTLWRDSSRRNVELWIRGLPGCGKSTLATSIIDQLELKHPTAYFFCNFEDPERSDFTQILRTITWQLVLKKPHLANRVYDIYFETAGATTPVTSYQRALECILKDGEPCHVVIDGLDECHSNHLEIQKAIFQINQNAKLLVISRWEIWIQQCFALGQMTPVLEISTTHTSEDLKLYINNRARELDLGVALTTILIAVLMAKAKGMFLWVQLTIEYLSQQPTLEDTMTALEDLPNGLERLYERFVRQLEKLPGARYNLARKLLQWTYSSFRPLSLEELQTALSVSPGETRQASRNSTLHLEKFIKDSCSPLLELDESRSQVRFVHASAAEFFSNAARNDMWFMKIEDLLLVTKMSNSYCASICLTYLATETIAFVPEHHDPKVYANNLEKTLRRHPFLQYCALNWWKHLPKLHDETDKNRETLEKSIRLFTSSQHCIVLWIQLFQLLNGFREQEVPQTALFRSAESAYACTFSDKDSFFNNLWTAPSGLFTRWQRWRTEVFLNGRFAFPLGIASFFNFLEVVKSECEKGNDIDTADAIGLTPALLAVEGESLGVLQYVISNGADIKRTSVFGYVIARYAARNCPTIIHMVFDAGALASTATLDDGGTAVHASSTSPGFHPYILSELLRNVLAADLDIKDFSGRTALHYSAAIDIQSYASLVSDRSIITAGALPEHRRLHASSTEEAFMPSTRKEIESWWQSWVSYFQKGTRKMTLPSFPPSTAKLEEGSIAVLVRNIKAALITQLVEGGASISEKDSRGMSALDIVLMSGFAEGVEVDENNSLELISLALTALGAKEIVSDRLPALDTALMNGHWVTAQAIIYGDSSSSQLPGNDQRFLADIARKASKKIKKPIQICEACYQPKSSLDARYTLFILRFCLKRYARSSYDESTYNQLACLIVDAAEYWIQTKDIVGKGYDDYSYPAHPVLKNAGAYLTWTEGDFRKIELFVLVTFHRTVSKSRVNYTREPSQEPGLPSNPILKFTRWPQDSAEAPLRLWANQVLGQGETVMIPSETFRLRKDNTRWEQSWKLPSNSRNVISTSSQEIYKWFMSLSIGDSISLQPTQDFFANDVALYGGFGFKIYYAYN